MADLREKVIVTLSLCLFIGIIECSSRTNPSETFYDDAFRIRSELSSTKSELRKTGALLLKASGLVYDQLKHPSRVPRNISLPSGLLRELSFALETGQGVPRNELLAFQFMKRAAELGDSVAHGEMFLRHSFGFHQDESYKTGKLSQFLESDIATGLVHGTFGALGNDTVSEMSLGYRHMNGHGVPKNCPSAIAYYNAVAEKVIELARYPGSLPILEKVRLNARSIHGTRKAKVEQWLQYHQYSADLGDTEAQTAVGQLYNLGSHGIKRDYTQALRYFQQAAEAGSADAMGHLGHMYANGLGVEPNNKTAIEWFKKAVESNNKDGHYGLGYMYLTGYGQERNLRKAFDHFSKAAAQEHTEAQFHLGIMHLKGLATRVSPLNALNYFGAASHGGHLLAMYNLAMMYVSGNGIEPDCNAALKLLKEVSEYGPWSKVLQQGQDAFSEGDYTYALLSYLRAAQMGLEVGQSNAAWMLEHGLAPGQVFENIHLALKLYKWSAEQDNVNSLLAVGDVFYYGRGIDKDWNRSAGLYQLAEKKMSSRAAFNLGFMYQFGAGLPKDLHLAKRYYDLAQEYNNNAYYAILLSVGYLRVHIWWESVRTFLPGQIACWVDVLFTCKYENVTQVPPGWWSGRQADTLREVGEKSFLNQVIEILDIDGMSDMLGTMLDVYTSDELGDLLETIFLATLIIVFLLVYRRRRANRALARAGRNPLPQGQTPVQGQNNQAPPPPPPGPENEVAGPPVPAE